MNLYRKLNDNEIAILKSQGCSTADWNLISVKEGFDASYIKNVFFGGTVFLGVTGSSCATISGHHRKSGIYNASIYDCTIGDNTLISSVGRYISGYDIGDDVVIENVGEISSAKGDSFGYGVNASVINEAGGREIPLCSEITAQTAYITAMYRHRTKTIERINELVTRDAIEKASRRAQIGTSSIITNTTIIKGVNIGEYTTIDGAVLLRNGSVESSKECPSVIGSNVSATDFIMTQSSKVDTGSMLRRCFVGEGVIIENGFSAENSVFFANSHCAHGEACSIFAGPFTVTHHRATLLIAGYFSFFNAGSGANQSNHMYKAGPVHQGIHLRGCKFSSDAYIMLPARTGVFSVVKGRHYTHHDTDEMPFSYLLEEEGDSYLSPAVNLRSFGLARDVKKWPNRDKRGIVKSDIINYDMMSPYSAGKVLAAIAHSKDMLTRYPMSETQTWNRVKIHTHQLKKGYQLYMQALRSYLGEVLNGVKLEDINTDNIAVEWIDLAGMITPKNEVNAILERLDNNEIDSITALRNELALLHGRYSELSVRWAVYALAKLLNKELSQINQNDIDEVIAQGAKDTKTIQGYINSDARKDSAPLMSIGYGIDSDKEREDDFKAVRS